MEEHFSQQSCSGKGFNLNLAFQKSWGPGHVWHLPLLLTSLCAFRRRWPTDAIFEGEMFFPILLGVGTVWGLLCHAWSYSFTHFKSGLRAEQFSSRTLLLKSQADVLRAECGLALAESSPKKTLISWQRMLLQNLFVPFGINGAFTKMQVAHDALNTKIPPYHHGGWL